MLRGFRGILTVLAGLILAGAQQPSETGKTQNISKQEKAAAPQGPAQTPTPESPYRPYADYNPDPCYNAQNHDTADLCAQWRSAIAAEKAAHEARRATNWAIVAAILTAIGTGGLIFTILQTRGALKEARRGNRINLLVERRARRESREAAAAQQQALALAERNAAAAENQIEIAANAQRPWLDFEIEIKGINKYPGGKPKGSELKIALKVMNYSAYPAHYVVAAGQGFYGNGLLSAAHLASSQSWVRAYLDEPQRSTFGDVVFPDKPSEIGIHCEILNPGSFSDLSNQTVTLCVGLRYRFGDAGHGYTRRTFFVVGAQAFIQAALENRPLPKLKFVTGYTDVFAT
jgi:hypothetical protein